MDQPLANLTSTQKDELMDQVKQQIAIANTQEIITVSCVLLLTHYIIAFFFLDLLLLQKITEKCFKKCIGKPGSEIDSSEQKCLAMCMDRYMDTINIVSRTYSARLQKERGNM